MKKRMAQPAFAMVLLFAPIWATAQDEPTIQAPLHPPAPTEMSTKESDVLVEAPEKMPEFPGGEKLMMTYIGRTVKYPEEAKENGIGGRVYLSFVVERDGSLSDIRVLRSAHPLLDREAIRVVKTMPKWTPGEQNGEPRRVKYTLPFTFKLAE